MSNPWTIEGARVKIASPKYHWEKGGSGNSGDIATLEAPEILKHADKIFLTCSGGGC